MDCSVLRNAVKADVAATSCSWCMSPNKIALDKDSANFPNLGIMRASFEFLIPLPRFSGTQHAMTGFNWADWTLFVIIAISTLMSLRRGFVKEAISLASWVVAFVVARSFHPNVQTLLVGSIENEVVRTIAAFSILFIGTLLVGAAVAFLVGVLLKLTGLSPIDRMLGMVFGMARGVILSVVLIAVVRLTPFTSSEWWANSVMIEHLSVVEQWTRSLLEQKTAVSS